MQRVLLPLLFALTLFADQSKEAIKAKILHKIFTNLTFQEVPRIYSDNEELLHALQKKELFVTKRCEDSTLIVLQHKENLNREKGCATKPLFVLDYALLKEFEESFGAMFYKKGRPNIVLIAPRAKKHSIEISDTLHDYTEQKVW